MASALSGLRVVDFSSSLAGALTTMALRDNGCEVLKVEPPAGDPLRVVPAQTQWMRGKRSIVLDLKDETAAKRARALAAEADIVLESWRPGVAERLGLGADDLLAENQSLIHCSITGFGPRGPYRDVAGYEGIVSAVSGMMATGERPRYSALPGGAFSASQAALQGILAALFTRHESGLGQRVQTSLVQGLSTYELYNWLGPQLPPEQTAVAFSAGGTIYSPASGFSGFTGDGRWLQFANYRPHLLQAFLKALDLQEWHEEVWSSRETADRAGDEVLAGVLNRLHDKGLDEWMDIFLAVDDIGAEPFRTPAEATRHPQVVHNGNVITVDDADLGPMRQIGPLAQLAATPADPAGAPPALDEHQAEPWSEPWTPPAIGVPGAGAAPLAGVTVLELAWFYAAPFGTALLADLGARVIKVEGLEGDPHRNQNPLREFAGVKGLQGKESVALDYRTPEGLAILHELVRRSDAVLCNYRMNAGDASPVSYASLSAHNPDLVYLYAGAYGSSGPFSARPAFAPSMSVSSGQLAYQLGWPRALDGGGDLSLAEGIAQMEEMRLRSGGPTHNGDTTAAVVVGTAMLLGLVAQQRHGAGQYLESTMLGSNCYLVSEHFLDYDGLEPAQDHDENGVNALYGLYEAQSGWVFLAAPTEREWLRLAAALSEIEPDAVELARDPRFADGTARLTHDAELRLELARGFAGRAAEDWQELLLARDVACVRVNREGPAEFTISSDVVRDNGFVGEVTHPIFGTHLRHGPVVTLSRNPGVIGPASTVGQHTDAVLAELGYSEERRAELRQQGVIGG